tara:strand:+ start:411 stop:584 length:174 start_codon:yes stop_codon:yes gene_type:complete
MGKLNQEEIKEMEELKAKLWEDVSYKVMLNPDYPLMISRYNYLVMRSVNNLLTLEDK